MRRRNPDFSSGPDARLTRLLRGRAREVTLFDTDAGGKVPFLERWDAKPEVSSWEPVREPRTPPPEMPRLHEDRLDARPLRERRPSLLVAVCVPALLAALGGALLAPAIGGSGDHLGPDSARADDLAREAARPGTVPPLVPVVERGGRQRLAAHPQAAGAAPTRPAPPARITIPSAGVDAPVDGLAARRRGLQLPALGRAGWWNGGPRPGEDGRAVVVGHLDSKSGPDVFARVPDLAKGDAIVVRDRGGADHHYAVVGVTRVAKAQFPTADVYGPAGRPVLVLITCGGPYDPALGHYRDNVLIYARAV